MSLKPEKKSDLGKDWMKPRRDKPKRIQPEYHLIVTEGTRTEPAYFESIKDEINRYHPEKVHLQIEGTGQNTLFLFEKAKRLVQASSNGYAHVWVVYDTDDFPAGHINETAQRCKKDSSEETKYHAIWSNQCIELWFLLHFGFFHSDIKRAAYFPKLDEQMAARKLGTYRKNRKNMYQALLPYLDVAIQNAKKLAEINEGKLPSDAAPGTEIYRLIEKLKPYLAPSEGSGQMPSQNL